MQERKTNKLGVQERVMYNKKVAAVVVTYNRKNMLASCINSILSQTRKPNKIIIIDNHSDDGTQEYLKDSNIYDNQLVEYHYLPNNIGGAGGFYEGMKHAKAQGADWVWIMDDDVIPDSNALEELLLADDIINEKVSFLASSVRGPGNEAMNVPKISRNQFSKYIDWYEYLDEGIVKIVKATFVSLLVNSEAIEKCGLPWKDFFIWGDDSEYTQRVIRDFGPAYMVGKSKVTHMRQTSDELSLVKETNLGRIPMYYYYYRNNLIGFWEYETFLYRFLCMGKLGFDFLMILLKGKYKLKKIAVIIKAFFAFVFGTYDRKKFKNRALL